MQSEIHMKKKYARQFAQTLTFMIGMIIVAACIQPNLQQTADQTVALADIPLAVNTYWVYQATRYDGPNLTRLVTTTHTITETIVARQVISSLIAAQIRRQQSAEVLMGAMQEADRTTAILNPAAQESYWLISDGKHLYSQPHLDPTALLSSTIEYELPFRTGDSWYLNHIMLTVSPSKTNESMLRRVVEMREVTAPAGQFSNCFLLTEVIGGAVFAQHFCPGVGIVEKRVDHHGTPFGFRHLLTAYAVGSLP